MKRTTLRYVAEKGQKRRYCRLPCRPPPPVRLSRVLHQNLSGCQVGHQHPQAHRHTGTGTGSAGHPAFVLACQQGGQNTSGRPGARARQRLALAPAIVSDHRRGCSCTYSIALATGDRNRFFEQSSHTKALLTLQTNFFF